MIPQLKLIPSIAAVGFLLGAVACLGGEPGSSVQTPDSDDPMVTIGEEIVTRAEVEEAAAENLKAVEMQRLQCESQANQNRHRAMELAIDELVRNRLLTAAAADSGLDVSAWEAAQIEQNLESISEQEVTDWYNRNQSRLRGATQEQVADQIKQFLATEKLNASLRESTAVEVMLEPYRVSVEAAGGPTKGAESAPVTIVEFSDFECPFCQRVNPTMERVIEEYGDVVQIVFRQFPLDSIHANARKAAEASLCADDQGKFWEMHDLMFAEQKQLSVASLQEKATRLGLDEAEFSICLTSGRKAAAVEEDVRAGTLAGVTGTPAIFVNGRPMSGAVPFEQMSEVIESELERLGVERTE